MVRRFEIIAVGAFPLAYMNVNLWFDVGRYSYKYASGDPNYALYAPIFFAPDNKPANSKAENIGLIWGSIALALGVATLDLALGWGDEAKAP